MLKLREVILIELLLLIAFVAYFTPAIIALLRGKANKVAIFFLNLLTGWTFVGWIVAFVWSLTKDHRAAKV